MTVTALLLTDPIPVRSAALNRIRLLTKFTAEQSMTKASEEFGVADEILEWLEEAQSLARVVQTIDQDLIASQAEHEAEQKLFREDLRRELLDADIPAPIRSQALLLGWTLADLRATPDEKLLGWPGVGPKTIDQLRQALDAEGT